MLFVCFLKLSLASLRPKFLSFKMETLSGKRFFCWDTGDFLFDFCG